MLCTILMVKGETFNLAMHDAKIKSKNHFDYLNNSKTFPECFTMQRDIFLVIGRFMSFATDDEAIVG